MIFPDISIDEFNYYLPDERIAKFPLAERNLSKLLIYKNGQIQHGQFKNLAAYLPKNSSLVLNDTKVVAARLHFKKKSGAIIEIFCLEPYNVEINHAMQAKKTAVWKCLVGNLKRFKHDDILEYPIQQGTLYAKILDKESDAVLVEFNWDNRATFAEILKKAGEVPLPPYLKREAEKNDTERYQTVYAQAEGAVAAPTAGLHFTPELLQSLKNKGIHQNFVTLHVGAGTFKPVKTQRLADHKMHAESIIVELSFLEWLQKQEKIIAVGTTSLRCLESIYWIAVKALKNGTFSNFLTSKDSYNLPQDIERKTAIGFLIDYLKKSGNGHLMAKTALFAIPAYNFKIIDGLLTNFHQPKSTLLALIAALVGNDWKNIYTQAFDHNYRFLSYGDSSLLIP